MFSNDRISSQQQQFGPKRTAAKARDQITEKKGGEVLCVPFNVELFWSLINDFFYQFICKKQIQGRTTLMELNNKNIRMQKGHNEQVM